MALKVTAAIYARKSTEQTGVADEARSVTRQIDHARAFASAKGWVVSEAHIFVDDGISGAEFERRPAFLRLMNALKPRPAFDVLIMSEESRLGREAIETAYALKQIIQAGVRVWFYLEDRERTLESPTDKLLLSVTAFADELEREKARQRTYDAMVRKAKAGHVTGGRVFGYDNVEIRLPDGTRSHVERRINEAEAAVVRRIFDMSAAGHGLARVAKRLNAEGVAAPRAQQGRVAAWAPSSLRAVLRRSLYVGSPVWNQTKKRDRWGRTRRSQRPAAEWLRLEQPDLQIVSVELWTRTQAAVQARTHTFGRGATASARMRATLLAGFARCACCGGGFGGQTRMHGTGAVRRPAYFYGCTSHVRRGDTVCTNRLVVRQEVVDAAVLDVLIADVLRPEVLEQAIGLALDELTRPAAAETDRDRLVRELDAARQECERLAEAIGQGGPMAVLLDRLRAREAAAAALAARLKATPARGATVTSRQGWERRLRAQVIALRDLLTADVVAARDVLRTLLVEPIRFTPLAPSERGARYQFSGAIGFAHVIEGVIDARITSARVASPTGAPDNWSVLLDARTPPRAA